jgi:PAT family beta-lactamase induction signal transducer AmpG
MGFAAFANAIVMGLMTAALPVFTVQEMGWEDNQFPQILSASKLLAGVLGMFIGGALIDLIGRLKIIRWLIILLILCFAFFGMSSGYWENAMSINAFIIVYHILDVLITIVIFAIAMQLCWKQVAATQFTLYMMISNLGLSFGSYVFGYAEQWFTWEFIFLINIVFLLIMFVFIRLLDFDKHQAAMEKKFNIH